MSQPIRLAYTFGNHMHWVDMQWLWGSSVLPGSAADMLAYCAATGAKGCLNFDAIGLEKLAAEDPSALQMLKEAAAAGTIEVTGGSYGQPYGLFHGGESNIRQRVHGVRACLRLLGARPKTFWEEEFDFHLQLPQMLAGCGFEGASLFFQWTWHTPELPFENSSVAAWEGLDGTKLPAAARNRMNLHQWPEDFQILLNELAESGESDKDGPSPLILQWLELMPSKDWMCRSELMIPMLLKLKSDPRFQVEMTTLTGYLSQWAGLELPVRRYGLDDVWHGMTLGKNGDRHPRRSAAVERKLIAAEAASAVLSLFGRPYDPWDVYPSWELEEAWRSLLAAQHHDNHECQGLCGYVAEAQFDYAESLLENGAPAVRLARRVGLAEGESLKFSSTGPPSGGVAAGEAGPAMGYWIEHTAGAPAAWRQVDGGYAVSIGQVEAGIAGGRLWVRSPQGEAEMAVPLLGWRRDGQPHLAPLFSADSKAGLADGVLRLASEGPDPIIVELSLDAECGGLKIVLARHPGEFGQVDPGLGGALRLVWPFASDAEAWADTPFAIQPVGSGSRGRRKYPEGDWMTSPQWFEDVEGAFVSHSLVRLTAERLLVVHDGTMQWFRGEAGLETVLHAVDPWDGGKGRPLIPHTFWLIPHAGDSPAGWFRIAASALAEPCAADGPFQAASQPLPRSFSAVHLDGGSLAVSAFYREEERFSSMGLADYAGKGMGHPFVLRLVELDGRNGEAVAAIAGPVAAAWRTSLMGEHGVQLEVEQGDDRLLGCLPADLAPFGISASRIRVSYRPHEIITLYLDIVPGRKQFRDLDAKREIWATVHRVEG